MPATHPCVCQHLPPITHSNTVSNIKSTTHQANRQLRELREIAKGVTKQLPDVIQNATAKIDEYARGMISGASRPSPQSSVAPGQPDPSRAVAMRRVDNYGAGFLRSGARAVFAEGTTDASYILANLFTTTRTIGQNFQSSPRWDGRYDFQFQSRRTPIFKAWMDPKAPTKYYRSVVGDLGLTAKAVRGD